jgi:NADH-quinone oxidoreductase subunit H
VEAIVAVAILVFFVLNNALLLIWMERKISAAIQRRYGPNRVGPYGLLQTGMDAIKLMTKEHITPAGADRWVFLLAPIVVFAPALMLYLVVPFGKGAIASDLNVGMLYVFALASLTVLGIFMAGWSSDNKYALLSAMRSVAQLISYEVPLILSILGVVILTGSLSTVSIVNAQHHLWFILLQPIAAVVFVIAALAEVNRVPFDIVEAESELVAGFHIEYSGMRFALFFLAEFTNTFTEAALFVTLFLGGWQPFFISVIPSWVWFFGKTYLMVMVLMWVRSSLPRFRVDQFMAFGWKALVPASFVSALLAVFESFVPALVRG